MYNTRFFAKFKQLNLPKAKATITYNSAKDQIKIESEKLLKNFFIDHKEHYVHFSDNYFDVVPGFPVTVTVLGDKKLAEVKAGLKFTSLRQAN